MSIMLKCNVVSLPLKMAARAISSTPVVSSQDWRASKGLPRNKTAEGILTDGPDYTFLDGRPTPLLHKQKKRMIRQQNFASRIVELSSELTFAKQRHQDMLRAEEEKRQNIIQNRLKPKGSALLRKS